MQSQKMKQLQANRAVSFLLDQRILLLENFTLMKLELHYFHLFSLFRGSTCRPSYLGSVLAKHNDGRMFKTSREGITVTTRVVGVLTQIYGPSEIMLITSF